MQMLFDGEIQVHYGFLFLQPGDLAPDLRDAFGGQSNGLCGAAHPGVLAMVTGLHTGGVPVRIETHELAPPLDESWEEIVEVSVTIDGQHYGLSAFDEFEELPALEAGQYRARWHASGMEESRAVDTRMDGDEALDRYLLQLWPAAPAGDVIIRQTSEIAAYWHGVARSTPAPPPTSDAAPNRTVP
jgi:hypothetical protein